MPNFDKLTGRAPAEDSDESVVPKRDFLEGESLKGQMLRKAAEKTGDQAMLDKLEETRLAGLKNPGGGSLKGMLMGLRKNNEKPSEADSEALAAARKDIENIDDTQ